MRDTEIKAASSNLYKILVDKDKFYQIPNYQRPYSWDKDNIAELIGDLTQAFRDNRNEEYYCGSLVLVKNERDNRLDIIDGQQRLTTFSILACVIRDLYDSDLDTESKDYINESIKDRYRDNEKLRVLTDETYQAHFKNVFVLHSLEFKEVKDIDKEFKDDRYMQNAYHIKDELQEFFKNNTDAKISEFVKWLYTKVILTEITCPNEAGAIRIFNVLNNRGMPLSSTDILKSSLMQKLQDEEDRKAFKQEWSSIDKKLKENELRLDDMLNTFLYHTIARTPKKRLDEELLATEEFKNENSITIVERIKKFSDVYIEILDNQANNKYIHCLKYLPHRIYWASILSTAKFIDYKELNHLIKILTAYYYQNFIAGATANRFKQTSFNILKEVKKRSSITTIEEVIRKNLDDYKTTNEYREKLKYNNAYYTKWAKPVLLLVEYFSTDDTNPNFIEINNKLHLEHVLPQDPTNQYSTTFTQEEMKNWTDSLANLTLLNFKKNIQARNFDFSEKKETYKTRDDVVTSFHITRDIIECDKWDVGELEKRQEKLVCKINDLIDIFSS